LNGDGACSRPRSAPVYTATTPGIAAASLVSIELIRAWAMRRGRRWRRPRLQPRLLEVGEIGPADGEELRIFLADDAVTEDRARHAAGHYAAN